MKNLSKKSDVHNNQAFAAFSKFQLNKKQLKNIKGGNDGSGDGGEEGIITDDVIGG